MEMNNVKELAIQYLWSYLGKPYLWGGDDPMKGLDCSGLICEILQAFGRIGRKEDLTAHDLYIRFQNRKLLVCEVGCLVFWRNFHYDVNVPLKIIHVEMAINNEFAIGASGGGSFVKSVEDAIKYNAFIKIRPIQSREGIVGFYDPWREN